MDFGLAKLKGSLKLTKTSSTVGTLAYMAPEQIQGGEVDARSDIFSFGIVLYEILSGQLPFRGDHEAAMMYSIVNLGQKAPRSSSARSGRCPMTQRQVTQESPHPPCKAGHTARHMLDARRASAGGGHLIECQCGSTRRHADFDAALMEWKRMHRIRTPRPKPAMQRVRSPRTKPAAEGNVVQLGLRLRGGRARHG